MIPAARGSGDARPATIANVSYYHDPLTHLRATTRTVERAAVLMHELAHELCDGRLIALGGGGYDIWRVTPRAWTLVWAALGGQAVPDAMPAAWLGRWSPRSPEPLPARLRDDPAACAPIPRAREVAANNAYTFARVSETSLPLIKSGLSR